MYLQIRFFLVTLLLAFGVDFAVFAQPPGASGEEQGRRSRGFPGPPGMMGGGPGMMGRGPGMMGGGPGMMGRGPGMMGGGPGNRGGFVGGEGNERMLQMLRAMDANKNGRLEQNEIPDYRRNFVSMVVTRMGGDPSKTIDLAALERRTRSGTSGRETSSGTQTGTASGDPPLVPAFGEKTETESVQVLAFGKKPPEEKAAAKKAATPERITRTTDTIQQSARDTMNKFDKNKNGYLDKDKGEWLKTLPFDPEAADKNRDGRVSMQEMIAAMGGKTGASSGYIGISFKPSEPYDRLPSGVPDWFFQADQDQDGQMTMLEYQNVEQWKGKPWSKEMADEFNFLDTNGDGIVTIDECFTVLKRIDEEKARKADAEKRQQERLKGTGASSTAQAADDSKAPDASKDSKAPVAPPGEGERPDAQSGPGPQAGSGGPAGQGAPPPNASRPENAASGPPPNAPYASGTQRGPGSSGNREYRRERGDRGERGPRRGTDAQDRGRDRSR